MTSAYRQKDLTMDTAATGRILWMDEKIEGIGRATGNPSAVARPTWSKYGRVCNHNDC